MQNIAKSFSCTNNRMCIEMDAKRLPGHPLLFRVGSLFKAQAITNLLAYITPMVLPTLIDGHVPFRTSFNQTIDNYVSRIYHTPWTCAHWNVYLFIQGWETRCSEMCSKQVTCTNTYSAWTIYITKRPSFIMNNHNHIINVAAKSHITCVSQILQTSSARHAKVTESISITTTSRVHLKADPTPKGRCCHGLI